MPVTANYGNGTGNETAELCGGTFPDAGLPDNGSDFLFGTEFPIKMAEPFNARSSRKLGWRPFCGFCKTDDAPIFLTGCDCYEYVRYSALTLTARPARNPIDRLALDINRINSVWLRVMPRNTFGSVY